MASHLPFLSHFSFETTIFLIFLFSIFTPSFSALDCASQKLNRTYSNCTDLPTLGATLHFTYNATNHSLAVAYAATPPKTDGWVAWGINPTGTGMLGTQAFIAFKQSSTVTVKRYNLTSYGGIDEVKALSFESWDLSAEEANGVITIFATVSVPEKKENLSQVWQVGPTQGGKPIIHEKKDANLNAMGVLQVVGSTSAGGGGGGNSTAGSGGDQKSGGVSVMGERVGLGFYIGGLVLVLMSLVTM